MEYLGNLSKNDPLFDCFRRLAAGSHEEEFRVYRLRASNSVCLYEGTLTRRRLIGKFFYHGQHDRAAAHAALCRETANLEYLRSFGFDGGGCHYIARPLGLAPQLNECLLEEYCYGETLTGILQRTFRYHDDALLYGKLTALAFFLSRIHNRTARPGRVDFRPTAEYADRLLHSLRRRNFLDDDRRKRFSELMRRWHDCPEMWSDNPVFVHGDATPENFLFGDGLHVISFDLERMHLADRLFDVGRIGAEIAHAFMLNTGDRFRAEPFLGHLLWEYSCHFPDRSATFAAITKRFPFYMGINFLRLARNSYFNSAYRARLLDAAEACL